MQNNDPKKDQVNELVDRIQQQLGKETIASEAVFEIEEIDEAHGALLQADPSAF